MWLNELLRINTDIYAHQTLISNLLVLLGLLTKLSSSVKALLNDLVPVGNSVITVFVTHDDVCHVETDHLLEANHKDLWHEIVLEGKEPLADVDVFHGLDATHVPGAHVDFNEVKGGVKSFVPHQLIVNEVLHLGADLVVVIASTPAIEDDVDNILVRILAYGILR